MLDEDCYRPGARTAMVRRREAGNTESVAKGIDISVRGRKARGSIVKIAKVLNNNIAVAVNDRGQDVIVMGCGVAFGKKHGDDIDESKIERLFTQGVPDLSKRFSEMVGDIPEEYFEAVQSIIANAKMRLGHELDDNLYLALTDHVHFAVERCRKGVVIRNRLLVETKMIYREEFEVAREAVSYLNARFAVELPEDEAAFIALHLVNANTGSSMGQTFQATQMVQEINALVRNLFHVEIDPDSLDYYRMMVHLKFFAMRVVSGSQHAEELRDRQLFELIRVQYAQAFRAAERIAAYISQNYGFEVPDNEMMYLTIHLQRVYGKYLSNPIS
ncbi:transcription antiterminator LicT [Bifidobacterium rousetti]|uniref:BglG family transcription antiterminator LicT n=1 Tax=Bifidobacterium rousetti TaxID=2045439 RepID=UPI00123A725A|nr:PRD domain-containing protein [Bifidobacterium rousetti]KAA8819105.1 transcription antiterminator LicT [Bifidobacterium rousetti]